MNAVVLANVLPQTASMLRFAENLSIEMERRRRKKVCRHGRTLFGRCRKRSR